MTEAQFKSIHRAQKAAIRRISAENTWLRHTLMQIEGRIATLDRQCDALQVRLKTLKKSLDGVGSPIQPPAQPIESRSKK